MTQTPTPLPPHAPQNSGKAIASLVVSIVSLFICLFLGIIGIVLGHMALNDIRNSGGTLAGGGLAIAGIIIGWVDVALSIILLCVWLGMFGLLFHAVETGPMTLP